MSETINQQVTEKEPTPDEIKAFQKKRTEYYTAQLPLLRMQGEFEKLVADIEENRVRAATMRRRYAEMMAPPTAQKSKSKK